MVKKVFITVFISCPKDSMASQVIGLLPHHAEMSYEVDTIVERGKLVNGLHMYMY